MVRRLLSLLMSGLAALCLGAGDAEARKLALIIGNNAYANLDSLDKAVADAGGYSALFSEMGFDVTLALDLDSRAMASALLEFYDSIAPDDVVLFAYSGHGWSDGRENFLMPTDIAGQGSQEDIRKASFAVRNGASGIIDEIVRRGPRLTVAVIDACRENPFTLPAPEAKVVIGSQGLVTGDATGTFIAFSAGDGQQALDNISGSDPVPYSVFTRYFLHELSKPQDLQTAFKATQKLVNDTAKAVGREQLPASYDEVVGSACLWDDCTTQQVAIVADPNDPVALARAEWEHFKDSTSIAALEAFAERHAGTPYAELARERVARLQAQVADAGQPGVRTPGVDQPAAEPAGPAGGVEVASDDSGRKKGIKIKLPRPGQDEQPAADRPQDPPPGEPADPPAGGVAPADQPEWCASAFTVSQWAICNDADLVAREWQVADIYAKLYQKLGGEDRQTLYVGQEKWMIEREGCNGDLPCLRASYDTRIAALMAM